MHKMTVNEKYYMLLKNGHKTIELRLFDEKRKVIKIGDIVEFSNSFDKRDFFQVTVIDLHKAKTFESLCNDIDIRKTGFNNKIELMNILEKFYSLDKQVQFGVLGIEIEKGNRGV